MVIPASLRAAVVLSAVAFGIVLLTLSCPATAAYTADRLAANPIVMGYRRAYALQDGLVKGWGYASATGGNYGIPPKANTTTLATCSCSP